MLIHLRIANHATIEQVEMELDPGFNVLTGETGAGKSIIVGAASLLRGGRATPDTVRAGASHSEIEALFDVSAHPQLPLLITDLGLPVSDDGELLVRRIVSRAGRSRSYVNGSLCTLSMLSRVTGELLDIAGQHEHQSLSRRGVQLRILDELAGVRALREQMRLAHETLQATAVAARTFGQQGQQRSERIDFLRFQLREIDAAGLRPDEDRELEALHRRLARAADLAQAAGSAERTLYSDEGAICEQLATLHRRLSELAHVDAALTPLASQLDEARLLIEDAGVGLGRYATGVELDPAALERVEQRLALIHRLTRKHGGGVVEVLARAEQMRDELDDLQAYDSRLAELEADLDRARAAAAELAGELSTARARAAQQLSIEASRQLQRLSMETAALTVALEPLLPRQGDDPALVVDGRRVGAAGWDQAELHIVANAGEASRPLARFASGGELSRVMLALRQVIGEYDPLSTSIYDEVDAGIGGKTADVVGRCLAGVARHRQVLCVTHLPQVAAHGERHFHVGKVRRGERTQTLLQRLCDKGRVEELARMLGGQRVSQQARANARQLLAAAHRPS